MKRTVKKLLAGSVLAVFVFVCGLVSIVFFPEPLFAHKHEYKQFRIYSDQPVSSAIENVLDNALHLTQTTELYDSAHKTDIFLSFGNVFNTIDDKVLGHGPSARATDNNIVLKVRIDPDRNLAFPTFYDSCQADLTWLIAHEMVHCLQENRYGKVVFNPFNPPPMWKLEGYPEYVSRKPMRAKAHYDLKAEIERYLELDRNRKDIWMPVVEGGCKSPWYYYKSRLMTEYLIDVKGLTYDDILNSNFSENDVFEEMLSWKESNEN